MKCPKCHSENPDTKPFCGDCGTPLIPSADAEPSHTETLLSFPVHPDTILSRIPAAGRPLLCVTDPRRRLAELLTLRLPDYARASDLVIDAGLPSEDVVKKILHEIH